jgi:hypothetical protein
VSLLLDVVKWCDAVRKPMWAGTDQTIAKYLARGAEPQARAGLALPGRYHSVLVIPARDEQVEFVEGVSPALAVEPGALLIVVVNANRDSTEEVLRSNQQLIEGLRSRTIEPALDLAPGISALAMGHGHLLLVDCSTPGRALPQKQGVGLARKIGCDIALRLWTEQIVSNPWLFSSDADVTLPSGYFSAVRQAPVDSAAVVFEFAHHPSGDVELDRATFEYELYLRYYTLGLAWAGSPYAFHTLGSCMAIRAEAYAAVRGFPKREAGEDFHLLSKLAKVGAIHNINEPQVKIAARHSQRAPFGTGARVATLLSGEALGFHDPRLFALLRTVLEALQAWARNPSPRLLASEPYGELWACGSAVLEEMGLSVALQHAQRVAPDADDRLLHLHTWFDALKTLRLLRGVQQRSGLPELTWREALLHAPFVGQQSGLDLPQALERVRQLGYAGSIRLLQSGH